MSFTDTRDLFMALDRLHQRVYHEDDFEQVMSIWQQLRKFEETVAHVASLYGDKAEAMTRVGVHRTPEPRARQVA